MNGDQTTPRAETAAAPERGKPRTDWLAWSLQLVLGMVVGFGVGFQVARLLWRSGFASFEQMFLVMAGVALGGGAFASYYGDRAWMAPSVFEAPGPPRTETARTWSMIIGILGGALVVLPICLHVMTAGWPSGRTASGGLSFFRVLLVAFPGGLLIHALRTGTGLWGFGTLDREETPLFYWLYVFVLAFGLMCLLFGR